MPTAPFFSRLKTRLGRALRQISTLLTLPSAAVQRLGVSFRTRRVSTPWAAEQLGLQASSPAIYAALHHRCLGMQVYPLAVHLVTPGGKVLETIDPLAETWAADLLRLLQRPDPSDLDRVFPWMPGELFLAKVMADLLMTGVAYIRYQQSDAGNVTGLYRLHPAVTTLEYSQGARRFRYRPSPGVEQVFHGDEVCVLRWLSAGADLSDELGIGAAQPLQKITEAEVGALARTASAIAQGGVDLSIEPTNDTAAAMLMSPENRETLVAAYDSALSKEGSRILVGTGGFKLTEIGLKPADLRAPETQAAARQAQLMALGVVPVAVGADSTSYATAAAQLRVQYGWDQELATWIEIFLFRPLAQHFARRSGNARWAARASYVTCAWDLSKHPGALAARTEGIARMTSIIAAGWTNAQAAAAEDLDLPPPEGTPQPALLTQPGMAGPTPQLGGSPADALGGGRTLGDLFPGRMSEAEAGAGLPTEERAALWRAIEDGRASSDANLRDGARAALDQEQATYDAALRQLLEDAWDGQAYGAVDWGGLPAANPDPYTAAMGPPWLTTWEDASQAAVPDALGVPVPSSSPSTLDDLGTSAQAMANTTRRQVLEAAQAAVRDNVPPEAARAAVRDGWTFSADRDLAMGRTETVRAQSAGTNARYDAAEQAGIQLEIEWLAAQNARDDHRAIDGHRVPVGGRWTLPNGVTTAGPGLSGDPGEDINCRCATRPVLK